MKRNTVLQSSANKSISQKQNKSIGKVDNLEEHVNSEWWKQIFNSNYLKTDGDIVEDDNITRTEVEHFLNILKPDKNDHILDICCGQGRHLIELSRNGYKNLFGIDRSRYLIQKARNRSKNGLYNISFKEGDARKLPYGTDSFDLISVLGNSFGYFDTKNDDYMVLEEIRRCLKPGGRLLMSLTDGEYVRKNYKKMSWEWIDKNSFVCRERNYSTATKRLITREIIIHINKGILADQFYAEHLYKSNELQEMLLLKGFTDVKEHGYFMHNTVRNQDLGMMEKQIVFMAKAEKDWSRIKVKEDILKEIYVIMGDPQKPDILKPLCKFDDDDYYTIDTMKKSLESIKKYKFSYINNHDTLIQDLVQIKNKNMLVFNLCDEGFENNAIKELHVPAILETLNIPYSGAGPQCLAYCYDKSLVRGIAKEMSIPVPKACFINPEDSMFDNTVGFPVILKPNCGDSSFGITQNSVAYTSDQLLTAISEIRDKFGYEKPILLEELLTGSDITIGLIGNKKDGFITLPVLEEDYSCLPDDLPKICGYEAKWLQDSPYWKIKSVPAKLPENIESFVIECCMKLFTRLECRDYARFDWRLSSNGTPKLLEVNPNPGWCWDGHLAKMSKIADIDYNKMLELIIDAAAKRYDMKIK
jgi:D-alanine-D-alanine ligase